MKFTSERLVLRSLESKDAKDLFAYRSDALTNQYQGWIPKELKEAEAFIAKLPSAFNEPDTWYQLGITDKDSKELMGDIGIHFIDEHQVEVGCTLAKRHQKKGIAQEALKSIVHLLFHVYDKHRIIGSVDPANKASILLLERLGFRKEAHFKESLLVDGKWVDDVVYALLKRDWNQN